MRSIICGVVLALLASPVRSAQVVAQPTTRPASGPAAQQQPRGDYDVTNWVVLIVDPNVPLANAGSMFKSGLPPFAESRRPGADEGTPEANQPAPMGLIRFAGPGDDPQQKIDVLVEAKGGRFLARWPRARSSADRELWKDVRLTNDDAGAQPVEPAHWFASLRKPESAWVNAGGRAEKFLLFDAEVAYPNPLKVEGGKDGTYQVSDAGAHALHDLQLYLPAGNGWRAGGVDHLAPSAGGGGAPKPNTPTPPPAANQRAAVANEAAVKAALDEAEQQKKSPAAATTTAPATQPASNSAKITLGGDASSDAAQALAPWRQRLAGQGVAPSDIELILTILARHALEKDHLTAVYRMNPAELDNTLKLEVVSEPRKVTRVALVVVRNIDPAIVEQIDGLIAQLGDPDWNKREAASKKLAEVGALARPKLEAALGNKDLEVAWRAERLLASLAKPAGQRQPGR